MEWLDPREKENEGSFSDFFRQVDSDTETTFS
jgi:hypothetical protein